MNIHEYQAKEILRRYGVTLLNGKIALSPQEAKSVAKTLGSTRYVVKAQVHAGGRGKAGGIKLAKTPDEVETLTEKMIGMTLATKQTGAHGKIVHKVYIEEGCDIEKEFYVALLIDRQSGKTAVIASREGGMDIEEVAEKHPEAIHKILVDPLIGLAAFQARQLAFSLGLQGALIAKWVKFVQGLYAAFENCDCALLEINPMVQTKGGDLLALDAKMNFDSNALFRHPEILALRDIAEEDPAEVEASHYDLAFIKLDGEIGCLVNGAGLAMATMDIIKLHGSEPANFLDVGGGADKKKVTEAFKIILKDKSVKGILVNIFGGIMRCDIIAEGVIAASREIGLKVPLVVRLEGTNVELGRKILGESGLNIIPATDLTDAAKKVVKAIRGV